jgi:hypothetical protein
LQQFCRNRTFADAGMRVDIEGNPDAVSPLVCGNLGIDTDVMAKLAWVLRMTWKFAQASPTFSNLGFMCRYQTLSRQSGLDGFSDGNTHASGSVPTNSIQAISSPAIIRGIATVLFDDSVFGVSISPRYTLCPMTTSVQLRWICFRCNAKISPGLIPTNIAR